MGKWDGRYSNTKEAKDGLEGDLLRAMEGKMTSETGDGGTLRVTDTKIDVYGPSNSSKGHYHEGYNAETGERYGHK